MANDLLEQTMNDFLGGEQQQPKQETVKEQVAETHDTAQKATAQEENTSNSGAADTDLLGATVKDFLPSESTVQTEPVENGPVQSVLKDTDSAVVTYSPKGKYDNTSDDITKWDDATIDSKVGERFAAIRDDVQKRYNSGEITDFDEANRIYRETMQNDPEVKRYYDEKDRRYYKKYQDMVDTGRAPSGYDYTKDTDIENLGKKLESLSKDYEQKKAKVESGDYTKEDYDAYMNSWAEANVANGRYEKLYAEETERLKASGNSAKARTSYATIKHSVAVPTEGDIAAARGMSVKQLKDLIDDKDGSNSNVPASMKNAAIREYNSRVPEINRVQKSSEWLTGEKVTKAVSTNDGRKTYDDTVIKAKSMTTAQIADAIDHCKNLTDDPNTGDTANAKAAAYQAEYAARMEGGHAKSIGTNMYEFYRKGGTGEKDMTPVEMASAVAEYGSLEGYRRHNEEVYRNIVQFHNDPVIERERGTRYYETTYGKEIEKNFFEALNAQREQAARDNESLRKTIPAMTPGASFGISYLNTVNSFKAEDYAKALQTAIDKFGKSRWEALVATQATAHSKDMSTMNDIILASINTDLQKQVAEQYKIEGNTEYAVARLLSEPFAMNIVYAAASIQAGNHNSIQQIRNAIDRYEAPGWLSGAVTAGVFAEDNIPALFGGIAAKPVQWIANAGVKSATKRVVAKEIAEGTSKLLAEQAGRTYMANLSNSMWLKMVTGSIGGTISVNTLIGTQNIGKNLSMYGSWYDPTGQTSIIDKRMLMLGAVGGVFSPFISRATAGWSGVLGKAGRFTVSTVAGAAPFIVSDVMEGRSFSEAVQTNLAMCGVSHMAGLATKAVEIKGNDEFSTEITKKATRHIADTGKYPDLAEMMQDPVKKMKQVLEDAKAKGYKSLEETPLGKQFEQFCEEYNKGKSGISMAEVNQVFYMMTGQKMFKPSALSAKVVSKGGKYTVELRDQSGHFYDDNSIHDTREEAIKKADEINQKNMAINISESEGLYDGKVAGDIMNRTAREMCEEEAKRLGIDTRKVKEGDKNYDAPTQRDVMSKYDYLTRLTEMKKAIEASISKGEGNKEELEKVLKEISLTAEEQEFLDKFNSKLDKYYGKKGGKDSLTTDKIKERLKAEGKDIDAIIAKKPSKRTKEESKALEDYYSMLRKQVEYDSVTFGTHNDRQDILDGIAEANRARKKAEEAEKVKMEHPEGTGKKESAGVTGMYRKPAQKFSEEVYAGRISADMVSKIYESLKSRKEKGQKLTADEEKTLSMMEDYNERFKTEDDIASERNREEAEKAKSEVAAAASEKDTATGSPEPANEDTEGEAKAAGGKVKEETTPPAPYTEPEPAPELAAPSETAPKAQGGTEAPKAEEEKAEEKKASPAPSEEPATGIIEITGPTGEDGGFVEGDTFTNPGDTSIYRVTKASEGEPVDVVNATTGEQVLKDGKKVEKPGEGASSRKAQNAGIEDVISTMGVGEEEASMMRSNPKAYSTAIKNAEKERQQAHAYAEGKAEKPRNWEYWADRDGLDEPKTVSDEKTLTGKPLPLDELAYDSEDKFNVIARDKGVKDAVDWARSKVENLRQAKATMEGRISKEKDADRVFAMNQEVSSIEKEIDGLNGIIEKYRTKAIDTPAEEIVSGGEKAVDSALKELTAQQKNAEGEEKSSIIAKKKEIISKFVAGIKNVFSGSFTVDGSHEETSAALDEQSRSQYEGAIGKGYKIPAMYDPETGNIRIVSEDVRNAGDITSNIEHESIHKWSAEADRFSWADRIQSEFTAEDMKKALYEITGHHGYDERSARTLADELIAHGGTALMRGEKLSENENINKLIKEAYADYRSYDGKRTSHDGGDTGEETGKTEQVAEGTPGHDDVPGNDGNAGRGSGKPAEVENEENGKEAPAKDAKEGEGAEPGQMELPFDWDEKEVKFRLLEKDDPKAKELDALPNDELVEVYRNVQAFSDDNLGSPMAFIDPKTGERRLLQPKTWNYSNPQKIELTSEQQAKLDELNKNGYIIVDGQKKTEFKIREDLKFVKPKTGEAKLKYFLKKNSRDTSGTWADYNPYDHAVEDPLNTQFAEAYKRPNLVVVKSLMPKSEIEGHFHADYAALPTGAHKWNNGRTLYLSRYSKIEKVLTRKEEAELIDKYWKRNPGKREELGSHRDYRRFVPQVRIELEKMGYRFELDGKELTPEETLALDKKVAENKDDENVVPATEGRLPYVTDEDIERLNAKFTGNWVGEPREELHGKMVDRVNELSKKLNTPIRIITSEDDVSKLPESQRDKKGIFNPEAQKDETAITVVIPKNANISDVENTVIHNVVGRDGLRVLFPTEEKLNNALDELYRVSNNDIRKVIDASVQKMIRSGNESTSDIDKLRREATEEYGAELAGRIGESGFEKLTSPEVDFWGKFKNTLQKALDNLMNGLGIKGGKKWGDKEWAYLYKEAYDRKKNGELGKESSQMELPFDGEESGIKFSIKYRGTTITPSRKVKLEKEEAGSLSHALMTLNNTYLHLDEKMSKDDGSVYKGYILNGDYCYLYSTENGHDSFIERKLKIDPHNYQEIKNIIYDYGTDDISKSVFASLEELESSGRKISDITDYLKRFGDRRIASQNGEVLQPDETSHDGERDSGGDNNDEVDDSSELKFSLVKGVDDKEVKQYNEAIKTGDEKTAGDIYRKAVKAAMSETKAVDAEGNPIHLYHGTARADRVGYKFSKKRSTSGPMAFFTDSKEMGDSYARNKRDTSLYYNEYDVNDYHQQFRVRKPGNKKSRPIEEYWYGIPSDRREEIMNRAFKVRCDWDGDGKPIFDENTKNANGGFEYQLKERRGNVLKALFDQWLDSGNLFRREGEFMDVLKLTGITDALKDLGLDVEYEDPWKRVEKTYDVYLNIKNPFDTSKDFTEKFLDDIESWLDEQPYRKVRAKLPKNSGADMWDKNSVSGYDWVDYAREDVKDGTTHSWTRIPDIITEYLKSQGYDGIKDTGGKHGGDVHNVWIPFEPSQVKSADPITYTDKGKPIPLEKRLDEEKDDIRFSMTVDRSHATGDKMHAAKVEKENEELHKYASENIESVRESAQKAKDELENLNVELEAMSREAEELNGKISENLSKWSAMAEGSDRDDLARERRALVADFSAKQDEVRKKQYEIDAKKVEVLSQQATARNMQAIIDYTEGQQRERARGGRGAVYEAAREWDGQGIDEERANIEIKKALLAAQKFLNGREESDLSKEDKAKYDALIGEVVAARIRLRQLQTTPPVKPQEPADDATQEEWDNYEEDYENWQQEYSNWKYEQNILEKQLIDAAQGTYLEKARQEFIDNWNADNEDAMKNLSGVMGVDMYTRQGVGHTIKQFIIDRRKAIATRNFEDMQMKRHIQTELEKYLLGNGKAGNFILKTALASPVARIKGINGLNRELIGMVEGTSETPEALKPLVQDIRNYLDDVHNFLVSEGLANPYQYRQNYLPHIWDMEKSNPDADVLFQLGRLGNGILGIENLKDMTTEQVGQKIDEMNENLEKLKEARRIPSEALAKLIEERNSKAHKPKKLKKGESYTPEEEENNRIWKSYQEKESELARERNKAREAVDTEWKRINLLKKYYDARQRGITQITDAFETPEKDETTQWSTTKSRFMNERTIESYKWGMEHGLVPKYDNVGALLVEYGHRANEAVGNRNLINMLRLLKFDGKPVLKEYSTSPDPEYTTSKDLALKGYEVLRSAAPYVNVVFGELKSPDFKDSTHKIAAFYDAVSGLAKSIALTASGFHAIALTEGSLGTQRLGLLGATWNVVSRIGLQTMFTGKLPTTRNPELVADALEHMVKLGGSGDYNAKEVVDQFEQFANWFGNWGNKSWRAFIEAKNSKEANEAFSKGAMTKAAAKGILLKVAGTPGRAAANVAGGLTRFNNWILWNLIHDSMKMYAYKTLSYDVRKNAKKKGWDEATTNRTLDEIGQFINDTFGGQNWDTIMISKKSKKWSQRIMLSPDWNLSVLRHMGSLFGASDLYNRNSFMKQVGITAGQMYSSMVADNEEISKNPSSDYKKKKAWSCIFTSMITSAAIWSAVNLLNRKKDMEAQRELVKKGEITKSPYEVREVKDYDLSTGQGLLDAATRWREWVLVPGVNTLNVNGKQSYLFLWTGKDGIERYMRWGKQYREIPDLIFNSNGEASCWEWLSKIWGKKNPMMNMFEDVIVGGNMVSMFKNKEIFDAPTETEGNVARLRALVKEFTPFSMRDGYDEEVSWVNFMMPVTKGVSSTYKAKQLYKLAFLADGGVPGDNVKRINRQLVQNGYDPTQIADAVKKALDQQAAQEFKQSMQTGEDCMKAFDEAKAELQKAKKEYSEAKDSNARNAAQKKVNDARQKETWAKNNMARFTGRTSVDDINIIDQEAADILNGVDGDFKEEQTYYDNETSKDAFLEIEVNNKQSALKIYKDRYDDVNSKYKNGEITEKEGQKILEPIADKIRQWKAIEDVKKKIKTTKSDMTKTAKGDTKKGNKSYVTVEEGMKQIRTWRIQVLNYMGLKGEDINDDSHKKEK